MDRSAPVTSSAESKLEAHPIPEHWKIGYKEGEGFSFSNVMLFIGVGKRTAEEFWESTYPGCPHFEKGRNEITKRITHINLVAGLLLTTIATFCTTDPPANSTLLPYTRNATYMLLLVSFSLSLGGLIVGSTIAFTIARCTSEGFCNTMLRTRGRLFGMLFILAYPFLSVGVSTLCLASALLIAASRSDVHLLKYGGYPFLVLPMTCGFLFIWIVQEPPATPTPTVKV